MSILPYLVSLFLSVATRSGKIYCTVKQGGCLVYPRLRSERSLKRVARDADADRCGLCTVVVVLSHYNSESSENERCSLYWLP